VKDPISTKNKDKMRSPRESRRNSTSSSEPLTPQVEDLKEFEEELTRPIPSLQHILKDIDLRMSSASDSIPWTPRSIIKPFWSNPFEVKLNPLKAFTGKREDLKKFLQDTSLYLLVNDKVYDTGIEKMAFALSFMNEGDAASWKEQLLEDAMALPSLDLGSWTQFKANLEDSFKPYDTPGDALEEMKALRMGNNIRKNPIWRFSTILVLISPI
jgi:hypothetical protein